MLIIALLLAVATGLLFGFFPALHSTRPDLVSTIRANTGQLSSARASTRFRTILVTAQIALSMALLISAGLFIKSLANVSRVDLGVKVDNVVTFGVSPELNGYTAVRSRVFFQAAFIASSIRSARRTRLLGSPSLYLPAVTLPLAPLPYITATAG